MLSDLTASSSPNESIRNWSKMSGIFGTIWIITKKPNMTFRNLKKGNNDFLSSM